MARRSGTDRVVSYRSPCTPSAPKPYQSRVLLLWLGGSFVLTFAVLLVMVNVDIRMGEGFFAYRYSPVRNQRTMRMFTIAPVIAVACAAVWWLTRSERIWRRRGMAMLVVALLGAVVWVWSAPPAALNQHGFVMRSPSTDGAFVTEAEQIGSMGGVRAYLRNFEQRVRKSVAEMRGTRVLSNPPGTTLLAYVVLRATAPPVGTHGWVERLLIERHRVDPDDAPIPAASLRVGAALTLLWGLSGVAAYALGRLFLSPVGAAVFAMVVTFNPCTVHFVPGKDAAQLLTINAMLWAWLAGWKRRRGSMPLCGLAGALLVIGSTFGLIHIWVALAGLVATVWQDPRRILSLFLRCILPATIGSAVVVIVALIALDWNIPQTLPAVSRRWAQLQPTFQMNRAVWYLIGLPILLLFVTPAMWAMIGLSLRRRRIHFGTRLAIATAAVMLLIYFGIGMTYELPRLWVAFLPPLVLGLAIDRPLLRYRGEHPRAARAILFIVVMHLAFTAFHWTLLDAREAEYRLTSDRYFD